MTKKVVIAAAGRGSRMLHLAKNKSKSLINVNKKPFLYYLFKNLKDAGYEDFILVVGAKEELFYQFLEDYNYKAKIVNQFKTLGEDEYGTACPLKCVKDIVGKEDFLCIYGDNLYSVEDLRTMKGNGGYNRLAGCYNENPEKYGVLLIKEDFLEKIVEKPKERIGNIINTGLYNFTSEIFDKIYNIEKSERGEYELTDAVNLLAREGKVKVREIKEGWLDFGNPGDVIKLSRYLKNGD